MLYNSLFDCSISSLKEDTGRELHHYLSHGFNILKVFGQF